MIQKLNSEKASQNLDMLAKILLENSDFIVNFLLKTLIISSAVFFMSWIEAFDVTSV